VKRLALALGLGVWLLLIVAVWRSEDLAADAAPEQDLSDNGYQIASAFPLVINDSGQYVRLGALYWMR